ncbi:tryptophan--tRNA ligase [Candidatus Saccharibacteria bacterium]|nr:tryptophan--tRNA ligase [Candidatus Saccharibacteria bacterium]
MQTILTGIRANEEPTLGNFLGAYLPTIRLAKEHAADSHINMFIPDLHSFTTPIDHSKLYSQIIKGVKYYLAAGLDATQPNIHIYRQSRVSAHSEMCWILDCFTYFGEASRMTQFKEKSAEHADAITVGLFNYPVLMAADILLYDAKYIPLGEDQFQHLELARNIAIRMNNKFDQALFTIPAPEKEQIKFMHLEQGLRIRSLTEPSKKMSKSSENAKSKISLNDDPAQAAKKIMSATTDSVGVIKFDMVNQPGISNLLQIEALLNDRPLQDLIADWAGQSSYGDLKRKVADSVQSFLSLFQEKVSQITDAEVEAILKQGESYANHAANQKLHHVQRALGLRPSDSQTSPTQPEH